MQYIRLAILLNQKADTDWKITIYLVFQGKPQNKVFRPEKAKFVTDLCQKFQNTVTNSLIYRAGQGLPGKNEMYGNPKYTVIILALS